MICLNILIQLHCAKVRNVKEYHFRGYSNLLSVKQVITYNDLDWNTPHTYWNIHYPQSRNRQVIKTNR